MSISNQTNGFRYQIVHWIFQHVPRFTTTMVLGPIHWWENYSNNQSLSKCQGTGAMSRISRATHPLVSAVYGTRKWHYFYNHLFTRMISQRTLIDNKFSIMKPKFWQILFHIFSFFWFLCCLYTVTKFTFIHAKDTARKGNGTVHILKTAISLITRYSLGIFPELIINVCAWMSMKENIILLQYKKLLYNGLS